MVDGKNASPRILIVRLSAIGDVVHGLPVLCALKEHLPAAHISWVVEGRAADLLRDHPALDRVITVPRKWLASWSAVRRLRRELREAKFDIAVDLQCLTKSAVAARLSGAPRRIGFGGRDGRELSRWLNNELVAPTRTHVIDRNLELLRALGIDRPQVRFGLPERAEDAATVEALVRGAGLERGFAVINPGAGWPSKLWPRERFAAVAAHLGQARRLTTVVVWAGGEEEGWAKEIVGGSQGQAILAPRTSLTELAALSRRAKLFIGSDTGPLHLAAAVGTPCVGLFGPMPAERNGPYGPQHIALQKVCLQGSSRERRNAGPESMEAISVADACAACDVILARTKELAAA